MSSSSSQQGQAIDLSSLNAQQLSQLKKQLDTELEHLTSSFQPLRTAQSKFKDCLRSIKAVEAQKETGTLTGLARSRLVSALVQNLTSTIVLLAQPHLIPLTSSLYVPGHFSHLVPAYSSIGDADAGPELLVDVGTGFFVSKTPTQATGFYNDKIKDLEGSLKELENVINGKGQNSRIVEDVLRQKVLAGQEVGEKSGEGAEGTNK